MDNRRRYDRLAPVYDLIDLAELTYKRRVRPRLFDGLGGRILDAAAGTGRNIPFYPRGAAVVACDASPGMLVRARARGRRLGGPAAFAVSDVRRLAFPDGCFDAVVAAFLFGVLSPGGQPSALAELARVCKPGGELRILDYTPSRRPLGRLGLALWRPWERLVYGGSFSGVPDRHLAGAGLVAVREAYVVGNFTRLLVARRG